MKYPTWLLYANLALAFLLELAALLAFAASGALAPSGWLQPVIGVAGAAVFVILWALCAAPRAKRRLKGNQLLAFKIAVFAVAVGILVLIGQPVWAAVLAVLVALNLWLIVRFKQLETPLSARGKR